MINNYSKELVKSLFSEIDIETLIGTYITLY